MTYEHPLAYLLGLEGVALLRGHPDPYSSYENDGPVVFEYHAWVSVEADAKETDARVSEPVIEAISDRLGDLDGGTSMVDFRWRNGMLMLHMAGMFNRRHTEAEDALAIFAYVGRVAPGSYGLLYYHDDEDKGWRWNYFHVLRMARGRVSERVDDFLSPVIPVIEVPWVEAMD